MEPPTPFYNAHASPIALLALRGRHAGERFRRLNSTKKTVLVGLIALAAILLTATVIYAVLPDAGATGTVPLSATTATPSDSFGGTYLLTVGPTQAKILTLRQFRTGVTGTLLTLTCGADGAHSISQIATGTLDADGALRLTLAAPSQPHSTQATYRVLRDANGAALVWRDPAHPANSEEWMPLTQSVAAFTAGWCGE